MWILETEFRFPSFQGKHFTNYVSKEVFSSLPEQDQSSCQTIVPFYQENRQFYRLIQRSSVCFFFLSTNLTYILPKVTPHAASSWASHSVTHGRYIGLCAGHCGKTEFLRLKETNQTGVLSPRAKQRASS